MEEYDPDRRYDATGDRSEMLRIRRVELAESAATTRRRHGGTTPERVPPPPLIETSFASDIDDTDLDALREGLNFALEDGNWFPSREPDERRPSDAPSAGAETLGSDDGGDYTDSIPLASLDPKRPQRPTLTINTDFEAALPRIHIDDSSFLAVPSSHNPPASASVLDPGRSSPHSPSKEHPPSSPSAAPAKFSEFFSRISDRIAGEADAEDDDSGASSHSNASVASPSRPATPSSLKFHNVSIDPAKTPQVDQPQSPSDYFSGVRFATSRDQEEAQLLPRSSATSSPKKPAKQFTSDGQLLLFGKSLGIFPPSSKFRQFCHNVVSISYFNNVMFVLLLLQVGLLSYRQWNPIALHGYYYAGYNWADYVLIVINIAYTVEIALKIVAYGLYNDRCMYRELGLPYPQNVVKSMFFQRKYVINILDAFGLSKLVDLLWNRDQSRLKKPHHNHHETHTVHGHPTLQKAPKLKVSSSNNRGWRSVWKEPAHIDPTDENDYSDSDSVESNFGLTPFESPTSQSSLVGTSGHLAPPPPLDHTNTFFVQRQHFHKLNLKRAFLRGSWHRIDFVSMVTFWISLLLSINHYDANHHIFLFRALSCLRILRFCNLTTGTSTVLTSIKLAMPQLIDVGVFISFFWLFFSIVGVSSFKSSLTRHCVWTNPDDPSDTWVNSDQCCGSWLAPNGTSMPYIQRDGSMSEQRKGFKCPINSQCISGDNPFNGTLNFDNVLQSAEIVFVVVSANTFTDIMYDTMDSDSMVASLFYISCIFICTVWLINVFIAVIVASFNITRTEESKRRQEEEKSVWRQWMSAAEHSMKVGKLKKRNWRLRLYYNMEFLFIILIFVDLIVQCLRTAYSSETTLNLINNFELVVTSILFFEIILRLVLYLPDWRGFVSSRRNMTDLALAIVTMVIAIPPVRKGLGQVYFWLTVFQILRIYRVVLSTKVTRSLWLRLFSNIKQLFDLALFFFIITYLVAIICARYFEGQIGPDDMDLTENAFPMHTLPNAFVALYIITSTENWTKIMYELQAAAVTTSQRVFGSMLLVFWFIFSNFIVLNIFIAVISKTLEVSEEGKRRNQLLQFIDNITHKLSTMNIVSTSKLQQWKSRVFDGKFRPQNKSTEQAVINLLLSGSAINDFIDETEVDSEEQEIREGSRNWRSRFSKWWRRRYGWAKRKVDNPFFESAHLKSKHNALVEEFNPSQFAHKILQERNALVSKQNKFLMENPRFNNVFYVIAPRHPLRRFCQRLVKPSYGTRVNGVEPYKYVSEALTVFAFLATIALVVTTSYMTPLYRKQEFEKTGTQYNWTFWIEVAFVVCFSLEFLIKVIADGFFFTPNAYCRSPWNIIDLIVLISIWIELIASLKSAGNVVRVVRGLKALRTFRLLTVSETATHIFHNTLLTGFTKIIEAMFISFCLLYPYSIWGLNIFNDRLGYCLDGQSTRDECMNEYSNSVFNWDIQSPNAYVNPELKFNRFSDSLVSLFEIISLEGWTDLLTNVMSSTGRGTPPQPFASPWNGIFVMSFNFISTVFILTLFISVIISNYSKVTGRAYMTVDQISWYQVVKILKQVRPSKRQRNPEKLGPIRRFCYRLTVEKESVYWTHFLNLILFLHVLCLLLEHFPSDTFSAINDFRSAMFMISSSCFLVNSYMSLIAKGFKNFFQNKWNPFFHFISLGAFVTTLVGLIYNRAHSTVFYNINELFLVAMLLYIIPKSNRLSQLLRFASASLPAILSLAFTWGVLFLVFAIAMCQIFGLTKIGPNGNDYRNLRSVPKALILLFRMSFGEGWNYIMNDYMLEEPFCTRGHDMDDSDCGNKPYAYILFIAWNLLSMYIFLNMFVSLILDSFSYVSRKSGYSHLIERQEIRKFKRAWQQFDPEGTGYISPHDLVPFIHELNASGSSLSFDSFFYRGDLNLRRLTNRWIRRNNPIDPYDISIDRQRLDDVFAKIDWDKVKDRRHQMELFIEEALMRMKLNNEEGISFTGFLLQVPLYTAFEAGRCLDLTDFLERRLLLQKVEKSLKVKRVYELVSAFALRWVMKKDMAKGDKPEAVDEAAKLKKMDRNSHQQSPQTSPKFNNPFKDIDDMIAQPVFDTSGLSSPFHGSYEPAEPLDTFHHDDTKDEDDSSFVYQEEEIRVRAPSMPYPPFGFVREVADTESLDNVEITGLGISQQSTNPPRRRPPPGDF
ncbi:hypothetical protein DIURU_000718 [Diutina rugosa]|uniref:Calcium-channel protein CCH1 n=1 Tax=Diutina rugosa TaxID=5481 RepID=A0A642UYJ0_DIURU|nr:uncharacterized protein DIURU_000718 [Diutina rugosa]KAA8907034.1 hypothetical protein DIURU_000718 [Diutina rugosa]